jgi:membrane protease YdiL (CAAX protease family)
MGSARRIFVGLAVLLIAAGVVWGVSRVASLQGREVAEASKPVALAEATGGQPPHVLASVELAERTHVVFEVCVGDALAPERWAGRMTFDVWYQPANERVLVTAMDEAFFSVVRRGDGRACAKIGEAPQLGMAGTYQIGVSLPEAGLPDELAGVAVQARILARPNLADDDRYAVWITLLGAIALAAALVLLGRQPQAPSAERVAPRAVARVAAGVVIFAGVVVAAGLLPAQGSTAAFVRGLVLAGIQVGLAAWLVSGRRPEKLDALALVKPRGGAWMLLVAVASAAFVWLAGSWLSSSIPSTGRAPIETFIAFPSGRVAYGTLAVIIPIAEELFFRGFVYGMLDRRHGANVATVVTVVLFAAVHLPQQWGAWGPAASVLLTGIILTLLRRYTRSTAVPAATHVLHNGVNTVLGLG